MADKFSISTINNKRFNPTAPTADNIEIEDIAHALSMLTRANGHFSEFYSVARHSINCAYEAEKRDYSVKVQLICLLHDSAEAYIGDMTRPLKLNFPYFSEIEKTYQKIIFSKYATLEITKEEADEVRSVDDSLLYHEFYIYNGYRLFDHVPEINIDVKHCLKSIEETKKEFLELYNKLSEKYYEQ